MNKVVKKKCTKEMAYLKGKSQIGNPPVKKKWTRNNNRRKEKIKYSRPKKSKLDIRT